MSKTYVQDKTQQDLRKYWSNNRSATKEKEQTKNLISSNSDPNNLEQLSEDNIKEKKSIGNYSISTDVNDKKRKVPVKEKTLGETSKNQCTKAPVVETYRPIPTPTTPTQTPAPM